MEVMEVAKTVLSEMIESGEVTEGQAVTKIVKHGIDYHTALDSLRKVYQEVGAERTPAHSGTVIVYRKPKKEPEKETSKAIEIAVKSAHRATNERVTAEIINSYRR